MRARRRAAQRTCLVSLATAPRATPAREPALRGPRRSVLERRSDVECCLLVGGSQTCNRVERGACRDTALPTGRPLEPRSHFTGSPECVRYVTVTDHDVGRRSSCLEVRITTTPITLRTRITTTAMVATGTVMDPWSTASATTCARLMRTHTKPRFRPPTARSFR